MEKQLMWKEKKLNYFLEGSGETVILLHGFLENYHIWDSLIRRLVSQFRVLAIDLPGFGKSDVFAENHGMPMMAQAVKAVMDHEKVANAFLVGHSMGGYVSMAFARLFPDKLKGVVLFHSHAAGDDEQGKTNRSRTIEVVKKDHKNFISQFVPLLFAEQNVSLFQKEIENLKADSLKTSAEGVIAAMAGMRDRDDNLEVLSTLEAPLFFVVGKQDSRIPLEKSMMQIGLPKRAEAIILDGVGHMGFVEAPEKIFPALQSFLERNV
jgi:pimeloyl-ACP methyl ester carboxylesterase